MSKSNQLQAHQQGGANLDLLKRDVIDQVQDRVHQLLESDRLHVPANYALDNALAAWWLALQEAKTKDGHPVLTHCTHNSIANATLEMIVLGLNPAKDQCYPIAYGKRLTCMPSYFGAEAMVRHIYPGARAYVQVIYQGDDLDYTIERGRTVIRSHQQSFKNTFGGLDAIAGAYAIVELGEGHDSHTEIMNIDQIKAAWARGENWPAKEGKQSAHRDHSEEFAKKTVIARACKHVINGSNDEQLISALRRIDQVAAEAAAEDEAEREANKRTIQLPPRQDQQQLPQQAPHDDAGDLPPHDPDTGEIIEDGQQEPPARGPDF